MSNSYNPFAWYWVVANSTTQVYSSAVGDYIPNTNTAFQIWLDAGNTPTQIISEAELGEVLAPYSLRPVAANVLDGYQDKQSREITVAVIAKVLLWLVNDARTSKGQTAFTAAQFRTFIKGLM